MTMAYTRKEDRTYRYYRCLSKTKGKETDCPVTQVPAGDLEAEVLKHLRRAFRAPSVIAAVSTHAQQAGDGQDIQLDHAAVLQAMRSLDEVWDELFPGEQERVVAELVDSLEVGPERSVLNMRLHGIAGLASELRGLAGVKVCEDGSLAAVGIGIAARRRCGRTRMVAPVIHPTSASPVREPDALMSAVARAFRWLEQLESLSVPSVTALAEKEGVDEAFVRRQLRLTLHPPRIIEDLAHGGNTKGSIREAVRHDPSEAWDIPDIVSERDVPANVPG
ncbi:MAG: hypothetical protein H0X38_06945 [Planctomycetes bacterium]|nr:hypothetical protein [Planctomycetota bacterium]